MIPYSRTPDGGTQQHLSIPGRARKSQLETTKILNRGQIITRFATAHEGQRTLTHRPHTFELRASTSQLQSTNSSPRGAQSKKNTRLSIHLSNLQNHPRTFMQSNKLTN